MRRAVLLAVLSACDCGEGIATVEETHASVERDHAARMREWATARVGESLSSGDGLRTGVDSTAQVSLRAGGRLEVRPETLIRFGRGADESELRLELEMGEVVLEGGDARMRTDSFLGALILEPGARVRLRAPDELEVLLGALELTLPGEEASHLVAGDRLGEAPAAPEPPPDPEEVVSAPPPASLEEEPDRPEAAIVAGPSRWTFDLEAGSPATVHAPSLPVRLAIRAPEGCREGVVAVGRGPAMRRYRVEAGLAPLALMGGRHALSLQCAGEARSTSVVRVLRDAGTAPLPRTPPTSRVELDGRNYTVLYQNQLPAFEVRWPGAASARLLVDGSDRGAGRGRWELEGGALSEGAHRLSARAGGRRAPETRVTIRFDNVAPKIALRHPANHSFTAGETVRVEGVLLPGWEAHLGEGEPSRGHFDLPHRVREDRDGFAVELRHARRGVHYYLREAR